MTIPLMIPLYQHLTPSHPCKMQKPGSLVLKGERSNLEIEMT